MQYVEETNLKYSLNLKFTKVEAPEVGLWSKIFQVADYDEDQLQFKQLASPCWSEPPQPQLHLPSQQHAHQIALLTDKPPLIE